MLSIFNWDLTLLLFQFFGNFIRQFCGGLLETLTQLFLTLNFKTLILFSTENGP
jgi:hypothetical protein